jgi:hypothetical protein
MFAPPSARRNFFKCAPPSLKSWIRLCNRSTMIDSLITIQLHNKLNSHVNTYYTLCEIICQWFAKGRWFSPGTPLSSTNKSDSHDIAEILLKAALKTIHVTLSQTYYILKALLYCFTVGVHHGGWMAMSWCLGAKWTNAVLQQWRVTQQYDMAVNWIDILYC